MSTDNVTPRKPRALPPGIAQAIEEQQSRVWDLRSLLQCVQEAGTQGRDRGPLRDPQCVAEGHRRDSPGSGRRGHWTARPGAPGGGGARRDTRCAQEGGGGWQRIARLRAASGSELTGSVLSTERRPPMGRRFFVSGYADAGPLAGNVACQQKRTCRPSAASTCSSTSARSGAVASTSCARSALRSTARASRRIRSSWRASTVIHVYSPGALPRAAEPCGRRSGSGKPAI